MRRTSCGVRPYSFPAVLSTADRIQCQIIPRRLCFITALVALCNPVDLRADEGKSESQVSSVTALCRTFVSELIPVKPGTKDFPPSFKMGPSGDSREVALKEPFRIAKYEVPQNLYEALMGENPSRWKGPRNSVEMMTIAEASDFCEKLTVHLRRLKLIEDSEVVRLPTESEWEYCCRAGTTTSYSFGEKARKDGDAEKQASLLDPYAWHTGNAAGNDPPVGALKPNPWGLYDVHGYLWEFVLPSDNGNGPKTPQGKCVIRGGSWKDAYADLKSSSRRLFPEEGKDDAVGFRCVVVRRTPKRPRSSSSQ